MKHESYEEKKRRILTGMATQEAIKACEDAKDFLLKGSAVDLDQVRRLKAKIQNINTDPGLEQKDFLFFYKGKYYFIQGSEMKKITEADVKPTLDDNPATEVYYICCETICPLPDPLTGKTKEAIRVKDDEAAAAFISKKSGITVTKNDL